MRAVPSSRPCPSGRRPSCARGRQAWPAAPPSCRPGRPRRRRRGAPRRRSAPTARRGSTRASARIAVAISVPNAKNASSPATLNRPTPRPAFLPFSVSSAWARRSSLRTSSGICSDSRCTRAPIGSSGVDGGMEWLMRTSCPIDRCGKRADVARDAPPDRPGDPVEDVGLGGDHRVTAARGAAPGTRISAPASITSARPGCIHGSASRSRDGHRHQPLDERVHVVGRQHGLVDRVAVVRRAGRARRRRPW